MLAEHDGAVDLAFQLEVDEWRGRRRAQLIVRDIHAHAGERSATAELVDDLFARADEILAREDYGGIEEAPSFHTKLVGVTFDGRQEIVSRLREGAPLRLARQSSNEHDPNACALYDPHGDHVGYLNRRLAAVLAPAIDNGVEYDVEITDVTGGEERSTGVNVLMTRRDAAALSDVAAESRTRIRGELSELPPADLDADLVRRFIGDRALHAAQVEALGALARGSNTLAVMATGRGKSLIFHLHAARSALREGTSSVFVFPLRALVADQAYHLEEVLGGAGLSLRTITGETAQAERDQAFAALGSGGLDVVLTTPEFLHFHAERFSASHRVGFVVVDEAHHVALASGASTCIRTVGRSSGCAQQATVAVTATASRMWPRRPDPSSGDEEQVLDRRCGNLRLVDRRSSEGKDATILRPAARATTVIYVNSRDASVRLARLIRKRVPDTAWRTAFYNGGLSRSVRNAVERAFRAGELKIIVATSAFGEGVNIPDIRNVVLYHMPFNDVEFNQMSGRAGRDGAVAEVHLLFGEKDARINERILSSSAPDRDDLAALYRVLKDLAGGEGEGFEIINAELAERCTALRPSCRLDDRGVSSGISVFRELGLVVGEGHGAYRRLTLVPGATRVELADSVRYSEGLDEIAEFAEFREWVITSTAEELLERFNRPILPTE
jgi:single-stranded-DNA-specific exonuclease